MSFQSGSRKSLPANIVAQRGMVLIVGLIMVLLMSIIALAAIRGSGFQESMAGNMRDRNLAFQAAEAGIRDGEAVLNLPVLPPFDGSEAGYYLAENRPGSRTTGYWDSYSWNTGSAVATVTIPNTAAAPRFVIEEVSFTVMAGAEGGAIDFESMLKTEDAVLYRVTGLGFGGTPESTVILQSTFKR